MIQDHFVRPSAEYQRETNHIPTYIRHSATYLQKMSGKSFEECVEFVKKTISPGGQRPLKRPMASVLIRDRRTGDRSLQRMPFDQFYSDAIQNKEILAPNMTGYLNADVKESIPAQYIRGNLKLRSKAKHEMFEATMAGDTVLESIKNAEQTTYKYKNNSLSGAHRSLHTPLYNKSSHSTLTSICRCATSYGNANNEKFLMGNRHYWSPDVVTANIVSVIDSTDLVRFQQVMDQFGLRTPTVDETMKCISRSSNLYWRNTIKMAKIHRLIEALEPIERAAFMYSGDLYHLAQCNPEFVKDFFNQLIGRPVEPLSYEEAKQWIGAMDSDLKAYISLLCAKDLDGRTIKELEKGKIDKAGVMVRPPDLRAYGFLAATTQSVVSVIDRYADLIKTFWVVDTMPASISYFPGSMRRTAITSDTDSTIFTVQHWVRWFTGSQKFDDTSAAVAYTAVYFTSQTIRHVLAKLSANLGARKEDLFELQMKNEFFYPVFALTSRAKHYFAYMSAREGNVLPEMKLDVKGVALRNSKVPVYFNQKVKLMMRHVLDSVMDGKMISMTQILNEIAEMEKEIVRNVLTGKYDHLTKEQIRSAEAYKNPESSNYIYHDIWQTVFAPKYGPAEELPYRSVKVSLNLNNQTRLKEWLDQIKDLGIRDRMIKWLETAKKKDLTMLLMPESILSLRGVPEEATIGVDTRQLVVTTMEAFYLFLESLGIYLKNGNNTRLVMDGVYVLPKHEE